MTIVFHVGYSRTHWSPFTSALGGTEQCVLNLSRQLVKSKHDVYVYGEVTSHFEIYNGHRVTYVPLDEKEIIPETIDVLIGVAYLHYTKFFEDRKVGQKIFWLHNEEAYPWYLGKSLSANEIYAAWDATDKIVCLTDWHRRRFIEANPDLSDKVVVIGNGVDTSSFVQVGPKIPDSYVYTSHAERGLKTALDDLDAGLIKGHLHIATPGYGEEYFEKNFRNRIKGDPRITYHGPLKTKDLYALLAKMQYWYYKSKYNETYCITALEMLGHRVTPVVTPVAGLVETLNGFFNPPLDWISVSQYIQTRDWSVVVKEWEGILLSGCDADAAYVICLDPSTAKYEEFKQRFAEANIKAPLRVIPASNGHTGAHMPDGIRLYKDWKIEGHTNNWWSRDILPGEIGCAMSHWRVWKDAYKNGYKQILVLEEDFVVNRPFNREEILTTEDWTLMYLGHSFVTKPKREINEHLVEPDYTFTTHAYMLTREGIRLLLEQDFNLVVFPVDEFLSATFCEHPRKDLQFITRDTRALAIKKAIFNQSSNKQNSTTEMITTSRTRMCEMNYQDFVKKYITYSARLKEFDLIVDEPITDVFTFPLFTEEFCRDIIAEAEENGNWTRERHQFYPTTDMLIDELGLQLYYQYVLQDFVYPVAIHKWGLEGKDWTNMESENFVIKYDEAVQGHLSLHHDSASISTVLALNEEYEGGGTWFWRQQKLHKGKTGHISVHPSVITHRHGGRPVTKGKRYILVSFCNRIKQ